MTFDSDAREGERFGTTDEQEVGQYATGLNDPSRIGQDTEVDLSDDAREAGGALPVGWYAATVIEGYTTTRSGTAFNTQDTLAKSGESRNLMIALALTGYERNIFARLNYRAGDLTISADRRAELKRMAQGHKPGDKWGDRAAQATFLSRGRIGQVQKALGLATLPLVEGAGINVSSFAGRKVDVRLTINEDGYNEVTEFAAAGSRSTSANGA